MKLFTQQSARSRRHPRLGFTLVEMLVASTIFLIIIVAAMISVQIYGLRVYNLATTKVRATTSGREAINTIRDLVRSSQTVYDGYYTNNAFTTNASGINQVGNAIQIFPTTNTAAGNSVVFFQDPVNINLSMVSNGVVTVVVSLVTNYYCFQAEDYQGNILTNALQNNPVIDTTLMFSQLAFPIGYSGGVAYNAYDYYRLRTRITMRVKN
jgi:prepilin-type N-terminal cleavage/methylation domain-containing protein